jgi:hypothetical protein
VLIWILLRNIVRILQQWVVRPNDDPEDLRYEVNLLSGCNALGQYKDTADTAVGLAQPAGTPAPPKPGAWKAKFDKEVDGSSLKSQFHALICRAFQENATPLEVTVFFKSCKERKGQYDQCTSACKCRLTRFRPFLAIVDCCRCAPLALHMAKSHCTCILLQLVHRTLQPPFERTVGAFACVATDATTLSATMLTTMTMILRG